MLPRASFCLMTITSPLASDISMNIDIITIAIVSISTFITISTTVILATILTMIIVSEALRMWRSRSRFRLERSAG